MHFADIVSAIDLSSEHLSSQKSIVEVLRTRIEKYREDYDDAEEFCEDLGEKIRRRVASELDVEIEEEDVRAAANSVFGRASPSVSDLSDEADEEQLLDEEWPALTNPTPKGHRNAQLVVVAEDVSHMGPPELSRLIESVHLVERLRELRAFVGFYRLDPAVGKRVRPDLDAEPPQKWLPATEVFGEGIMLVLSNRALREWSTAQAGLPRLLLPMQKRIADPNDPASRFARYVDRLDRLIVAHTFAHVLMRQLCYECGYGSASLRERLYVFDDRCGVLIYTADGDSEGSLGGLVRQGRGDRIGATIQAAVRRAAWCSNDPICSEMPPHGFGRLCVAACHACAYAPETSCVHLNALLDRRLLVGDRSRELKGFMSDLL